ncbi:putative RNA-binding protein 15B [Pongo abelii]|uniref:putative RNA-binding protein 15B n=1 Tax=Pongo abelii TaxID=9601 RepID=UPI0030050BFA
MEKRKSLYTVAHSAAPPCPEPEVPNGSSEAASNQLIRGPHAGTPLSSGQGALTCKAPSGGFSTGRTGRAGEPGTEHPPQSGSSARPPPAQPGKSGAGATKARQGRHCLQRLSVDSLPPLRGGNQAASRAFPLRHFGDVRHSHRPELVKHQREPKRPPPGGRRKSCPPSVRTHARKRPLLSLYWVSRAAESCSVFWVMKFRHRFRTCLRALISPYMADKGPVALSGELGNGVPDSKDRRGLGLLLKATYGIFLDCSVGYLQKC